MNLLPFPKVNLHQLSVHAAMNGDGVIGLNIPQPFEINRNVTLLHRGNRNRNGPTRIRTTCTPASLPPCRVLIRRLMQGTNTEKTNC